MYEEAIKEANLQEFHQAEREAEEAAKRVWDTQSALSKARRDLSDASAENRLAQEKLTLARVKAVQAGHISVVHSRPSYLGDAPVIRPPEGT